MDDSIIRKSLIDYLQIEKIEKNAIIISEMGLDGGRAIIDIAMINGVMCGFEIKSDLDTLYRLQSQIAVYEKYFNQLTIVTTKTHLAKIRKNFPSWVGIMVAVEDDSGVRIKPLRKPKTNRRILKTELTKLLWKDEAKLHLSAQGVRGISSSPRHILWEKIAEMTTEEELVSVIKASMISRTNWQVVL